MSLHRQGAGGGLRTSLAVAVATGLFVVVGPVAAAAEAAAGFRISAFGNGIGGGPVGCIQRAKELGLDGVEVGVGKPGDKGSPTDPEVQAACLKASQETGVAISSVSLDILNGEPLATSDTAERYVEETIALMQRMNVKVVLMAFFGAGDVKGKPEAIQALVVRLKRLAPKAEAAGVVLGLESRLSADDLIGILDAVGSPALKVYYDVCNTAGEGYDVPAELRKLGAKRLACVHVKENGTLLGHGRVDFRQVRAALDDAGYRGWLVIEGAVPGGASLPAAYAHNIRFLRSLFPEGFTAFAGAAAEEPSFRLALSERSLARGVRAGQPAHLDFPAFAKREFGVDAVDVAAEFVGDDAAVAELKSRAAAAGVKLLNLKVTDQGLLGDPDEAARKQAVANHLRFAKAAQALGCQALVVQAQSHGDWDQQLERTADGLRQLCAGAKPTGVPVLVENAPGQSANYAWLSEVVKRVGAENLGVAVSIGNFSGYDTAAGLGVLLPLAKAFTASGRTFDRGGQETTSDYYAAIGAIVAAGTRPYVALEYLGDGNEIDGTRALQRLAESLRVNPNRPAADGQPAAPRVTRVDFGKRDGWKVIEADSQETDGEDGRAQNVLDGNVESIWHTAWSKASPPHPHYLVVDLGQAQTVAGLRYLARQDNENGKIGRYEIYVSDDPKKWGEPVAKGSLTGSNQEQKVEFAAAKGRYLVLRALSEVGDNPWSSAAEIGAILK